jgi:hypothetical protein
MSPIQKALGSYKHFLEKHKLLPTFSDETVFFVVVALVVTIVMDQGIRDAIFEYQELISGMKDIIYVGVIITIYTTLFSDFRTQYHKWRMFAFLMLVYLFISAFTVHSILTGSSSIAYIIFPILNIAIVLSMLCFWASGVMDLQSISNRAATYSTVVYGSIVTVLVVLVLEYVFHFSWQIMLSMSVTYACLFNKNTLRFLPQLFPGDAKKLDTIENLAIKAVEKCREELLSKNKVNLFFVIVTPETSEVVAIPNHEQVNFQDIVHQRMFEQDRTIPYVAIAYFGTITFSRRFRPNKTVKVIKAEVYPASGEAYGFAEIFKQDPRSTDYLGKFVYIDWVKNRRTSVIKSVKR